MKMKNYTKKNLKRIKRKDYHRCGHRCDCLCRLLTVESIEKLYAFYSNPKKQKVMFFVRFNKISPPKYFVL